MRVEQITLPSPTQACILVNTHRTGKTTYQAEVLNGPDTSAKQLERVDGLVSTLCGPEQGRTTQ